MIKPLKGYILIKPIVEEEGIIITTQSAPDRGIVIEGNDIIQKNNKVIFSSDYRKVKDEDMEYFLLKEEDILAIYE